MCVRLSGKTFFSELAQQYSERCTKQPLSCCSIPLCDYVTQLLQVKVEKKETLVSKRFHLNVSPRFIVFFMPFSCEFTLVECRLRLLLVARPTWQRQATHLRTKWEWMSPAAGNIAHYCISVAFRCSCLRVNTIKCANLNLPNNILWTVLSKNVNSGLLYAFSRILASVANSKAKS